MPHCPPDALEKMCVIQQWPVSSTMIRASCNTTTPLNLLRNTAKPPYPKPLHNTPQPVCMARCLKYSRAHCFTVCVTIALSESRFFLSTYFVVIRYLWVYSTEYLRVVYFVCGACGLDCATTLLIHTVSLTYKVRHSLHTGPAAIDSLT